MAKHLARIAVDNAVLTAAVGALYAELAQVKDGQPALDAMLAKFTGVVEALPDEGGHVIRVADEIRSYAETFY